MTDQSYHSLQKRELKAAKRVPHLLRGKALGQLRDERAGEFVSDPKDLGIQIVIQQRTHSGIR